MAMGFDVSDIWSQICSIINDNPEIQDKELTKGLMQLLSPKFSTDNALFLSVENKWAKNQILQLYKKHLDSAFSEITGQRSVVYIDVFSDNEVEDERDRQAEPSEIKQSDPEVKTAVKSDVFHKGYTEDYLENANISEKSAAVVKSEEKVTRDWSSTQSKNSMGEKTFDSFVVADTNSHAYGVAYSVAENPGAVNNPLFIYGRSGLGKTHLLLAIKDYANKNYPKKKVVYAPTSDLTKSYVEALGTGDWNSPANIYWNADILLLDDVQYLEGKTETANEFFNIFNDMTMSNRQVVLSADRAPKDIELDERFRSRFADGVTVDIQTPKFETKYKIFKNNLLGLSKLHPEKNIDIPENVIERVVELSNSNIRNLEGAAASLYTYIIYARADKDYPITVAEAEEIVSKIFFSNLSQKITISDIQKTVEQYYKVTHGELLGSQRPRNISTARQVGMYLSRVLTQNSYPQIGKAFNKDHSSVVHAYNNIEKRRQQDKEFFNELERITDLVTASISD